MKTESQAWRWLSYLYEGGQHCVPVCRSINRMYHYGAIDQATYNAMNDRVFAHPNYPMSGEGMIWPAHDRHSRIDFCLAQAKLIDGADPCEFCKHYFDHELLGKYGCPNCEGKGL